MLNTEKCHCPYCGELIELVIDASMGEQQQYIEDCFVCCRPIVLSVYTDFDTGEFNIRTATENDC
ncbi:MAG: CPXCG motif-containing cysteine-rich protein [Cellvibrionaceae bacterium]